MSDWSDIIKQISVKQRLLALFLLLMFPVLSFLGGKYLDNNDCRDFIEENRLLHGDLIEISRLIRKQKLDQALAEVNTEIATESMKMENVKSMRNDEMVEIYLDSTVIIPPNITIPKPSKSDGYLDKILEITEKNIEKEN